MLLNVSASVICSPTNTLTVVPVSVWLPPAATEFTVAGLMPPVPFAVIELPLAPFTQVLARVRFAESRELVSVQTMLVSPAVTVSWAPASAVPLPVQARLEL